LDKETLINQVQSGTEITDVIFTETDWNGLELGGAIFRNCTFSNARFIATNFEDALFEKCSFSTCGFPRSKLRNAAFTDCLFFDAESKTGTDFSYAHMRETAFKRCNLSTSKFRAANLYEARFEDCMAQGCSYEKATFSHAIGGSANHTNTSLYAQATNFDYSDFIGLSLEGCTITACSFRESNLRGCDFKDADMSQTDLSGADTTDACFEGTDLRGCNLDGMMLGNLQSFDMMKIEEAQQEQLLLGLSIQIFT